METEPIIYFYDKETEFVKKEHIFLNNFEPSPFVDENGLTYKTNEHYYQCHKFDNVSDSLIFKNAFDEIRTAETADKCKKLARKYENEILKGKWQFKKWNDDKYKDRIMKRGLIFKFSQNIDMLNALVATKGFKLVERSEKDDYWGGFLPNSKNMLGAMLMELRDNYLQTHTVFINGSGLNPVEVPKA